MIQVFEMNVGVNNNSSYLAVQLGSDLLGGDLPCRGFGTDVALANLNSLLNMIPSNFFQGMQMQMSSVPPSPAPLGANGSPGILRRRPSL